MLSTQELTYAYANGPAIHFPDIHCKRGEHWLLLGQSGSGKTTLLHLLGGLLSPLSGRIKIEDTDITQLSGASLDRFRGRHIGIIFQRSHFVNALTVAENLALAQQLAGLATDKKRINELLERLQIADKAGRKPDQLSVGEQQRVAIARAIVNRPDVILADEPTSALDDQNCERVLHLLTEQARAVNATLLIVTHDGRLKDDIKNQIELSPVKLPA